MMEPDRRGVVEGRTERGPHEIAFVDWGPEDADTTVVCVHGLSRQGRDFDYLAQALAAAGNRVICPDIVGRGRSARLHNALDYVFSQYCADIGAVLDGVTSPTLHFVGTSLGGLIGMELAAQPDTRIARLVVNDIAPTVPIDAIVRVGLRFAETPSFFRTLDEAEAHFRKTHAACGPLSDDHWRHIARHSVGYDERQDRYPLLIDSRLACSYSFRWFQQVDLWATWDAIRVPTLVLRGEKSDFLTAGLAAEMARRNSFMTLFEVEGIGHMPMLGAEAEIGAIQQFLSDGATARKRKTPGRSDRLAATGASRTSR